MIRGLKRLRKIREEEATQEVLEEVQPIQSTCSFLEFQDETGKDKCG